MGILDFLVFMSGWVDLPVALADIGHDLCNFLYHHTCVCLHHAGLLNTHVGFGACYRGREVGAEIFIQFERKIHPAGVEVVVSLFRMSFVHFLRNGMDPLCKITSKRDLFLL
eukprot:Lithocolla_globosa_v1_NODE_4560_length_1410_cov_6.656089.p2 type:complete len:112 gc:universal NODE_4560_length_1410_cov_6.656089:719-384(-)